MIHILPEDAAQFATIATWLRELDQALWLRSSFAGEDVTPEQMAEGRAVFAELFRTMAKELGVMAYLDAPTAEQTASVDVEAVRVIAKSVLAQRARDAATVVLGDD